MCSCLMLMLWAYGLRGRVQHSIVEHTAYVPYGWIRAVASGIIDVLLMFTQCALRLSTYGPMANLAPQGLVLQASQGVSYSSVS